MIYHASICSAPVLLIGMLLPPLAERSVVVNCTETTSVRGDVYFLIISDRLWSISLRF